MALPYGMNITSSDVRALLEKNDKQQTGIRTWRQLFGNASLGYNAQRDALTTDYSDVISKAYASNFRQNDAIMSAGLATGITQELLAQSRQDLRTAYESYIHNYTSDSNTLGNNYLGEVGAINTALSERATNFAHLYNSAYDYLAEELYGATLAGDETNGAVPIKDDKGNITGYEPLDYFATHDLNWAYSVDPETGESVLRPWESLSKELLNPDGTLTKRGTMFFDQMFNSSQEPYMHQSGEREIRGFDEWLSKRDKTFDDYDSTALPGAAKNSQELREWWASSDDFNYTRAGTNKGTAQAMIGQESTDSVYGKYEYKVPTNLNDFATFDFSSTGEPFKQAIKALDDAEKAQIRADAKNELQAEENERRRKEAEITGAVYNTPEPYNADVEYAAARTAWFNYYNTVSQTYTKFDKVLQETVGASVAREFWAENGKLSEEYKALMESAKKHEYYNVDVANKVNDWYNRLLAQMKSFIKRHGYNAKTSGL